MRESHVLHGLDGRPVPAVEELELSIAAARRLRSQVVHEYLAAAAGWLRGALRTAPAPKRPAAQCC